MSILTAAEIGYINWDALSGKVLLAGCFYVNDRWQLLKPVEQGILCIEGTPVEGCYFAKSTQSETDFYLPFLNFVAQKLPLREVKRPFQGLIQDIHNLGASIKKIDLFVEHSNALGTGASRLAATELEYILTLNRSMFDLFQEIISAQWGCVRTLDATIKKKQLPTSFADICLQANEARSAEAISEKYNLPLELAQFYPRNSAFFHALRSCRDKLVHRGVSLDYIYSTEKGFALPHDYEPFCSFNVWNTEHRQANNLCSLRPILGHIIKETFAAMNDYAQTFSSVIECPPDIVPDMKFIQRSYFNSHLHECVAAVNDCSWWPSSSSSRIDS